MSRLAVAWPRPQRAPEFAEPAPVAELAAWWPRLAVAGKARAQRLEVAWQQLGARAGEPIPL